MQPPRRAFWRAAGLAAPAGSVALCAALWATPLAAQWQWTDAAGRRVYSDLPPPAGIPDRAILQRPTAPGTASSGVLPAVAVVPAASAAAVGDPSEGGDGPRAAAAVLPARKAASAASATVPGSATAADQRARSQARAENCARARRARATLESGQRLARIQVNGERVVLDEQSRATELQRVAAVIRSECDGG